MREDGDQAVVECDGRGGARSHDGPLDGTRVRIEDPDRASRAGREAIPSRRENVGAHGAVRAAYGRHVVPMRVGEGLAARGERTERIRRVEVAQVDRRR
jgi:hypothetical protein